MGNLEEWQQKKKTAWSNESAPFLIFFLYGLCKPEIFIAYGWGNLRSYGRLPVVINHHMHAMMLKNLGISGAPTASVNYKQNNISVNIGSSSVMNIPISLPDTYFGKRSLYSIWWEYTVYTNVISSSVHYVLQHYYRVGACSTLETLAKCPPLRGPQKAHVRHV